MQINTAVFLFKGKTQIIDCVNSCVFEYVVNGGDNMACRPFNDTITVTVLARAYVPMQKLCTLLEPTEALLSGTVFPELVSFYK